MMNAFALAPNLKASANGEIEIEPLKQRCYDAMNDDFNSPVLIAELFEVCRIVNSVHDQKLKIDQHNLGLLQQLLQDFVVEVLGLKDESAASEELPKVLDFVINLRSEAKSNQDYATSDKIRQGMQQIGYQLKDSKEGTSWTKI